VATSTESFGTVVQSGVPIALAEPLSAGRARAPVDLGHDPTRRPGQTAREAGPMSGDWWINLPVRDGEDRVFADGSPAVKAMGAQRKTIRILSFQC
jgi:hypothetical protein